MNGRFPGRHGDVTPAVLADLLRGDATAIDAWFRDEHPVVYRLCLGLLADEAAADDLALDAMTHLLDTLPAYDVARPWSTWRRRVVVNLARDRMRRAATRHRAEDVAASMFGAAAVPRPDDEAAQGEIRGALVRVLADVPPREREAFVLCDLEGVPFDDAAATLGIEASSVRSLLTLARRRLRSLLAPHLAGLLGDADTGGEGGRRG